MILSKIKIVTKIELTILKIVIKIELTILKKGFATRNPFSLKGGHGKNRKKMKF